MYSLRTIAALAILCIGTQCIHHSSRGRSFNFDRHPQTQDQSINFGGVPLQLQVGGSNVNEVVEQNPIATPAQEDPLETLAINIPGGGVPGEDYPILATMPETGFSCLIGLPGYFADPADESRCQGFHICLTDGTKYSFICPNGTLFNQQLFVCDWWFNVDCSASKDFQDLLLTLDLELGKIDEKDVGVIIPFDDEVQSEEPLITASNNNPIANIPIGQEQYYSNYPNQYDQLSSASNIALVASPTNDLNDNTVHYNNIGSARVNIPIGLYETPGIIG